MEQVTIPRVWKSASPSQSEESYAERPLGHGLSTVMHSPSSTGIGAVLSFVEGSAPLVNSPLLVLDRDSSQQNTSQHVPEPVHRTKSADEPQTLPTVLIVEDDPDISMALQDLLEFEGFRVDCAPTCHQAFSCVERGDYNAVLLDLGLPDGDGSSILEALRITNPSLPVIVLTASTKDLGSLPAYARLTKPWERKTLCKLLHQATGLETTVDKGVSQKK